MLQDGIFVRGDWIKDAANQATAVKFLEATFKGWIYCRDHYRACVNIVLANGPALPRGHQTWQMNEVNALIWPNKRGIGIMNPVDYAKTAKISLTYKVIKKPAAKASYRTDLARKAVANLRRQGLDVNGNRLEEGRRRAQGEGEVAKTDRLRAGDADALSARSAPRERGEVT